MSQNLNIAIIGAGLTGMVGAYRLAQKGHKVTIYESTDYVGGLASGFEFEGTYLEKTYHHIFKTDTDIINLVKELGIEDHLIWQDSSLSIYYENELHPFMTPLDLIKFKPLKIWNRVRAGLVVLYLQKTKNWKRFETISAYEWMRKYAGAEVTKVIWEPLLKGKFDNYFDKVAMSWLWARLHIRANSRENTGGGEKLGYFKNGFNVIVEALKAKLEALNVKIITGAKIESIQSTAKDASIKLNGKVESFDKLFATVPSGVFSKLVENSGVEKAYLSQLNSINYLGAICMIFTSEQDLIPYYWNNINDLSAPFLVLINHTKLLDKSNYNGKNVYYIGAYLPHESERFNMTDKQLTDLWFSYIKKINPDFDTNKVLGTTLFRFKNAQHIVDLNYAAKIPSKMTPLENVILSNFSQIYPEDRGTNYAVREGNAFVDLV